MQETIADFFSKWVLNPELNRTQIILIPKVPHPESLDQFRPISSCNFAYKIISKVLVIRLKQYLPSLISKEQTAFVKGRQIQNNILIVQVILHQLRIRKRRKKVSGDAETRYEKSI